MTQQNKRRGGRRPGSGRHRKRIFLNEETANTLAEILCLQRDRLKRPELSADEVVRDLIANAKEQRHTTYVEAKRLIQEVFLQKWPEIAQRMVEELQSEFDSIYAEMMQQAQEVANNWLEGERRTGDE